MKHLTKILSLSFLFFLVVSCSPIGQTQPDEPNRSDEAYTIKKNADLDREETIDESNKRYTGSSCKDEDKKHDCKDVCKDIYSRREDRADCEKLTVAQIERFEQVYKDLKDPDDDDLQQIDLEDLDVLINISIKPLDDAVGKYSKKEAKTVLAWIAKYSGVANLFEDEDDDFKVLDQLLKKVVTFTNADLSVPFVAKIDSGDTPLDISIGEGNDDATGYFQDFILEKQTTCVADETSLICLTTFCKIAKALDDDREDDWLRNTAFEKYIEDIIEEKTNGAATPIGSQWDTDLITDTGDLTNWEINLCGGLN